MHFGVVVSIHDYRMRIEGPVFGSSVRQFFFLFVELKFYSMCFVIKKYVKHIYTFWISFLFFFTAAIHTSICTWFIFYFFSIPFLSSEVYTLVFTCIQVSHGIVVSVFVCCVEGFVFDSSTYHIYFLLPYFYYSIFVSLPELRKTLFKFHIYIYSQPQFICKSLLFKLIFF